MNSVSVGNELVNTGKASASQVVAAIASAKSALKAAGFDGPISTVDTMSKHPFRGTRAYLGLQMDSSKMSRENILLLLLNQTNHVFFVTGYTGRTTDFENF